jgi:hypothetical protein
LPLRATSLPKAEQRGVQILAGIALLIIGLVALHAISDWLANRYPQPGLTTDAQGA